MAKHNTSINIQVSQAQAAVLRSLVDHLLDPDSEQIYTEETYKVLRRIMSQLPIPVVQTEPDKG